MTYSDVALLIDQYNTVTPEHAEAIADALARKGFYVKLEWNKRLWATEIDGYEVKPSDYRSPQKTTCRTSIVEPFYAHH